MIHFPVLQKEVIQYLNPKPNENFIDCTIGEGGHALAILEKNDPRGKILGIEWDLELFNQLKKKFSKFLHNRRIILVNDCYINLKEIVKKEKFNSVSGVLFDLGMSSWHLEKSGRGFSFLKNEPLDMRYSLKNPLTAEKILNYWSYQEIEKILREFGEEKFSEKISKEIIETRKIKPIKSTFQLVEIITEAIPQKFWPKKIHPATKTFQALRIAVNNELINLEKTLPQALEILKSDGKLMVISFHSLEDRIVKNFFKKYKENFKTFTKKPIMPKDDEIKINPRSRSAKMRLAIKK